EALKAYLEGEDAYRRIHMPEARAAFARAVAADPSFALAHAKLGWTLTDFPGGDRERAVAEVKRAIELEAELPPRDPVLIRGTLDASTPGGRPGRAPPHSSRDSQSASWRRRVAGLLPRSGARARRA